jgi:HAD superfamily hydrolase (TIGR01484 family)
MGDFETKRYVYCGDKIYCTKNDYDEILFHKWGKSALESGLVQYRGSLEEILESVGGGAMKFVASTENDSRHPEIAAVARNLGYFDVVRGEALHFEFTRKGVNKGKALRSVAAKMGISMQNVLAVGDSMNDYEMIRAAGMGVAMGNAMDDVKRIADAITLPVWESGVACAISRYVFGENEEPQGGENAQ